MTRRKRYSAEFKREALRRANEETVTDVLVAEELTDHKRFSLATDIKVYLCDPQSPWQQGSNENTNGLLRQYFPKGMDMSNVHQNRLNAVAKRLNDRPRETLQFYSPAERFPECAAAHECRTSYGSTNN